MRLGVTAFVVSTQTPRELRRQFICHIVTVGRPRAAHANNVSVVTVEALPANVPTTRVPLLCGISAMNTMQRFTTKDIRLTVKATRPGTAYGFLTLRLLDTDNCTYQALLFKRQFIMDAREIWN